MTTRARLLLAATIPFVLASTGCGPKRVQIALPAAELTTCADEPEAPALPAYDWSSLVAAMAVASQRDQMMLDYVLAFRTALGDCKGKVAGLKAWSETAGR